jgi:hypothetical protein
LTFPKDRKLSPNFKIFPKQKTGRGCLPVFTVIIDLGSIAGIHNQARRRFLPSCSELQISALVSFPDLG